MTIQRLFSYEKYKGTYLYLDTQKKYEIARTLIYFAISFSIFFAGYYLTGTKKNLLTIVAVLGMLPASKSLVSAIMFIRYKSCKEKTEKNDALIAYDMVFTSEKKNYQIDKMCISDGCIIGYSGQKNFNEEAFKKHIQTYLSLEKIENITIKVFTDIKAFENRIASMAKQSSHDEMIFKVLKQLVL